MALYLHVALERGIDRTGRGRAGAEGPGPDGDQGALTYSSSDAGIVAGERVRVPLGKGNTPADGIVIRTGGVEILAGLAPGKVKPILSRSGGGLPPALLELASWIASYYITPLGMVLSTMLPAAVKKQTGLKQVVYLRPASGLKTGEDAAGKVLAKRVAAMWEAVLKLPGNEWPLTAKEMAGAVEGLSTGTIKKMVGLGLLTQNSRAEVHVRGELAGGDAGEGGGGGRGESAGPTTSAERLPTLTGDQGAALAGIVPTLGAFAVHLIRGVTGSGKTEVYLRLIHEVLARGKRAIVLVPEIALTPQTSRRFLVRFGGRVAVLHSALSAAQRHAQWAACAAGNVDVVVGARSAVFAPMDNVGVIVVDEEHDSSYKQDQLPRYHARDVAIKRAQLLGCPCVLGSATPSLESWANAVQAAPKESRRLTIGGVVEGPAPKPRYHLHTLHTRATGAPMPPVDIVDLKEERKIRAARGGWRDAHLHLLGPTLEKALGETLSAGGQALLLLNRRGYANYIACPDVKCGWLKHCEACDATMVFHLLQRVGVAPSKDAGFVRCHHCLAEQILPRNCPQCNKKINTFGLGTQRVEEELERKFAVTHGLRATAGDRGEPVTMLRVDSDTMTTARDYFEALDGFARGEIRVLLGTQMIAKGLDFPNVRLVGVINADTSLNLPDFRATERTFQLVSQVAGRAGRAEQSGRVIVQTMEPDAPCIKLAAQHDYPTFATQELAIRARSGLPPIGKMARIVCRDTDHLKAEAAAHAVRTHLEKAMEGLPAGTPRPLLRGPMPCPISRIANHYRVSVEMLAQTRGTVQSLLLSLRSQGLLTSDAHTAVDVDPLALL